MSAARLTAVLAVLSALAGWIVVLSFPDLVIAGDVTAYFDRITAIEDGGIPYLDPVYEHLPVMLLPMFAARVLSLFAGEFPFAVAYSALMVAALAMTGAVMDQLGRSGGIADLGARWVWMSVPLFPLVVFRNDPVVVFLAVIALLPSLRSSWRTAAGVGAVLAKGWPVALVPAALRAGRRGFAAALTAAGALSALVMVSPGFRATQAAAGLHSETVGGGLLGLIRSLNGRDLQIEWTTAVYLQSPAIGYLLGPIVAAVIVGVALRGGKRPSSILGELALTGAVTTAILLAFRLFSTQYVLWLTPFAAASHSRWIRVATGTAATASLVMLLTWEGLFTANSWWWMLVAVRNGLICAVGLGLALNASDAGSADKKLEVGQVSTDTT